MLWYKGWLEARFRLLIPFGLLTYVLANFYWFPPQTPAASAKALADIGHFCVVFVAMTSIVLAGAGIATQPAFQATKGLHGSMYLTLSLPVSRFRGSSIYGIAVLLATFLDDQWRILGSVIAMSTLWWLLEKTPGTAAINIFRAMDERSPLAGHNIPWSAMAFSLGLTAILFFAALRTVQRREY